MIKSMDRVKEIQEVFQKYGTEKDTWVMSIYMQK